MLLFSVPLMCDFSHDIEITDGLQGLQAEQEALCL